MRSCARCSLRPATRRSRRRRRPTIIGASGAKAPDRTSSARSSSASAPSLPQRPPEDEHRMSTSDQASVAGRWHASVLTLFPDMFPGPLGLSLAGKALASGVWALDVVDIRDFTTDKHRTVDDTPAGGGPG